MKCKSGFLLLFLLSVSTLLAQSTTSFSLKDGDQSAVVKLILKKGKLADLDSKLLNYTKLQILDLTKTDLTQFPKVICELKEITWLKLGNNEIDTIPECICQLTTLTRLDLWDNNIFELPACLNDMPALKIIDLNGMKYNYEEQDRLLDRFSNIKLILSAPCDCNFD